MRFAWKATVAVFAMGLSSLTFAVAGDATSPHSNVARSAPTSPVLGYIESGDGLAALRRNLPGLTTVGVDGVNVTESGAAVSQPDDDSLAMLATAHRAGKPAQLLVGNYSDAINDFDPGIAHRLFTSAQNRRAVIASLVADTRRGWDGIQLDLESLNGSDMDGLSRFTTELRAALPPRKTLSMAVMANTTAQGYRDDAYNLPVLAKQLNQMILMAYDQHGPTWTGPGPVGGLPWARQSLRTMLRFVPRTKVVFGVAGYGYTWPTHGTGVQLSDADARHAAVKPVWDATAGEWHSTIRGGGTIWWSDARSLRIRRAVARNLHVDGVAVWSLGLSDTLPH